MVTRPYRPATSDGKPVPPSRLVDFRASHFSPGPCCLCPSAQYGTKIFTEAAIVVARDGCWRGEHLALCAMGACQYVGESIQRVIQSHDADHRVVYAGT